MFNLMRNLGGAIGLALIDTVVYSRTSLHANEIASKLTAGDASTASFVGIPLDMLARQSAQPLDVASLSMLKPLVEKAALTLAINDAWLMIALLTAVVLICIPFAKRAK